MESNQSQFERSLARSELSAALLLNQQEQELLMQQPMLPEDPHGALNQANDYPSSNNSINDLQQEDLHQVINQNVLTANPVSVSHQNQTNNLGADKNAAGISIQSYHKRIQRLKDQFDTFKGEVTQDKAIKVQELEKQIQIVDDRITDWHQSEEKRALQTRQKISVLLQYMEESQRDNDEQDQIFHQKLESLEAKLKHHFIDTTGKDQAIEHRLLKTIDDKSRLYALKIQQESRKRQEQQKQLKHQSQHVFKTLKTQIEQSEKQLEDQTQEAQQDIKEVLENLTQAIQGEASTKKIEASQMACDVLKSTVKQVKIDLDNERTERKANEETLLEMLESACNKLV